MKTTTEIETNVSVEKVTNAMVMPDGTCKLTVEIVDPAIATEIKLKNETFMLVEASRLSLNDKFMQYEPKTDEEREFKMLLAEAIKSGLKDFMHPKCDPSFNKGGICYKSGEVPAVGKTYNWWNQEAKKFKPEYNSRLGTKNEYVAFLGVLIKKLVERGWSVEKSWDAVCNNSNKLGHYWNSENAKNNFELTGCREICGFYDLANTCKLLAKDERTGDFWIAGGSFMYFSYTFPLADIDRSNDYDSYYDDSVGWIVLDSVA